MSKTEDRLESGRRRRCRRERSRGSRWAAAERPALGLPFAAYVPMGALSQYEAPKATVDPDRTKTWVKRAMPIVMAHKVQFFSALIFSFLGPDHPGVAPEDPPGGDHELADPAHAVRCTATSSSSPCSPC